jgi:DNA-binding NarL/FixJ family response regulator
MTHRSRVLAVGMFALAATELAAAVAAALAGRISFAAAVGSFTVTNGAMGLGFAACGILLAWHRPRNPIGWLFLAAGVADATSASAAQLRAIHAVAAGSRNAEIAQRMSIAPKTVANHIAAIFAKLQVADRNQAIILARDAGLGRPG